MVAEPRSLMNQRLKREHRFDQIKGKKDDGKYCLFGLRVGASAVEEKLSDELIEELLSWRFVAEYSIDTAALYGRINLEKLAKRGLNIGSLAPEDLAKVMYLAHHEGARGAVAIIQGGLGQQTAERNLPDQVGDLQAHALTARFNGNASNAYRYWLYELLVDKKINVAHFMIRSDGLNPRSMAKIAEALGGSTVTSPAAKLPSRPAAIPPQAGAAESWRDPLDGCVLRSAKLRSKKSATFGMTRIDAKTGKPRAHQGIDLATLPGTPIYAVANGKVVVAEEKAIPGKGYGKAITLLVDIKDLPQTQRDLALKQNPEIEKIYFFYAHLSSIKIGVSERLIAKGTVIGTAGDTGNADGMNTIDKGAHLHFEVRVKRSPGAGLSNRIDPKPFIDNCG